MDRKGDDSESAKESEFADRLLITSFLKSPMFIHFTCLGPGAVRQACLKRIFHVFALLLS